ncbi:MAG: hypothetical protein JST28_11170 [Acidobacteria bacterium]|nr:hypothetical protein [Acidobacteriota bacterium]
MKPSSLSHPILFTVVIAVALARPQQANQTPQYIQKSYPVVAGNEWPDKNSQMQMRQKQTAKKNFEAANLERKHQIDTDSEQLVQLAKDLKASVDRTDRETPDIIRKAELIEKLAHGVKEKMKLTVSGS